MKANGAEIIVKLLEREGIDIVAGIPGGANLPLYDALYHSEASGGIRHILARHEQGGGFIAQGMARSSGKTACCLATSGPGATNLITALADAKMDSVPLVAITGQVASGLLGTDAFQEIDTYGMTQSITKHNMLIRSAKELLSAIPEAFRIAASDRPGPVLIDVPKDVQLESLEFDAWPEPSRLDPALEPDATAIESLLRMIDAAERPLFYVGGGLSASGACDSFRRLVEATQIPAVLTLMALGCLEPEHSLNLGMLGMHGGLGVNRAVEEADLVIAIGARFDDRVTGRLDGFARKAAVAHIDRDYAEINKIRRVNLSIPADAGLAIEALLALLGPSPRRRPAQAPWLSRVTELKAREGLSIPEEGSHPLALIRRISRLAGAQAIVTTDVGQHQMWAAQAWLAHSPRSFLTSGGLGTMGFGLPAAIGAALANPGRKVVCLSGDGSIQMNIQELATLSELGLNLSLFILDNGHLGLVRQQQELFYGNRTMASRFASRPDFALIARGYGIESSKVSLGQDPQDAITRALSNSGPSLTVLEVAPEELVLPMVPPGKSNLEALLAPPKVVSGL